MSPDYIGPWGSLVPYTLCFGGHKRWICSGVLQAVPERCLLLPHLPGTVIPLSSLSVLSILGHTSRPQPTLTLAPVALHPALSPELSRGDL